MSFFNGKCSLKSRGFNLSFGLKVSKDNLKSKQNKGTHSKIRCLRKKNCFLRKCLITNLPVNILEFPCWDLDNHLEKEAENLKTRLQTDQVFLNLFLSSEGGYLQKLYKIEGILLPELRSNKSQLQVLLWFCPVLWFLCFGYKWNANGLKLCSQTTYMQDHPFPHLLHCFIWLMDFWWEYLK